MKTERGKVILPVWSDAGPGRTPQDPRSVEEEPKGSGARRNWPSGALDASVRPVVPDGAKGEHEAIPRARRGFIPAGLEQGHRSSVLGGYAT